MKVIQIPRRFVQTEWGGTETVVLETSKQLLSLGHQTSIFTTMALADSNDDVIEGIPVRRFNYVYPWFGLSEAARSQMDHKGGNMISLSLMNALRKEPEVDVIHLHTFKRLGGSARVIARRRGIPYVVSLHGGLYDVPNAEFDSVVSPFKGSFEWGKPLGVLLGSRRVVDDADAVICVGHAECEQIRQRYPNHRVDHLPNGVNVDRFANGDRNAFRLAHGIPEHAQVVLVVGRIDHQKNQLGAVQALVEIRKRLPDVYLVLIGHVTNGSYMTSVVRLAQELGMADRVVVIPGIDSSSQDLVNAYHAADVFLLPSLHEPFGIVILEAWAAGLPVAAARVGGVPGFVKHEHDGLLFNPEDSGAMAQAVVDILVHESLGQALAEAGHNKAVKQYSWETVTKQLIGIYNDVIDARKRKGNR